MAILGPQVGYSLCVLFPEGIMGRLYRRSLSGGGPVRHTPLNPESHGLQGDVPGTQARRGMFRMPLCRLSTGLSRGPVMHISRKSSFPFLQSSQILAQLCLDRSSDTTNLKINHTDHG
jgi:hypothetical protein